MDDRRLRAEVDRITSQFVGNNVGAQIGAVKELGAQHLRCASREDLEGLRDIGSKLSVAGSRAGGEERKQCPVRVPSEYSEGYWSNCCCRGSKIAQRPTGLDGV
jgi:hypothetical protein